MSAAQALEFRRPLETSAALEAAYRRLRRDVARYEHDRPHYPDIDAARELIASGELVRVVEENLEDKGALS